MKLVCTTLWVEVVINKRARALAGKALVANCPENKFLLSPKKFFLAKIKN